jgi:hypothetical protein
MVGDLRRVFLAWLKKTETDLAREREQLETDRAKWDEERKRQELASREEHQKQLDRLSDTRRRADVEMAAQMKQLQVERDEVRKRLAEERAKFEHETKTAWENLEIAKSQLLAQKETFEEMRAKLRDTNLGASDVVELNIGGTVFETGRATLTKDISGESLLAQVVSGSLAANKDKANRVFLDRDPETFREILQFLRNSAKSPPRPRDTVHSDVLASEAAFYGVHFFPFSLVFSVAGHDGNEPLRTGEVLDIQNQVWRAIRPMNTARVYAAAGAAAPNKFHVFGGQNLEYAALADCEVYDALLDAWLAGPPLSVARRNAAGIGTSDGRVLAIGGFDGEGIVSSVEGLDGRMKSWVNLAPLGTARSSASVGALRDGRIFVCGGTTGARLNTVEVYDSRANRWEKFGLSMSEVRSAGVVVSAGERLFALGGIDGGQQIHSSVEMLDEEGSHSWVFRQNCLVARVDLGGCGVEGSVLVSGGQSAGEVFNSVELYDVEKDQWVFGPEMIFPRYGHNSVSLNL